MPDYVYAQHGGQAAVCIYHLAPEKRVFADGRLELNTRETLTRYYAIAHQLAKDNPEAISNLTRDIRPGPDGHRQLPALLFDNNFLLKQRGLLQALLTSGRWRCVFSDLPTLEELAMDPSLLTNGATVFLAEERAKQLKLKAIPISSIGLRQASLPQERQTQP